MFRMITRCAPCLCVCLAIGLTTASNISLAQTGGSLRDTPEKLISESLTPDSFVILGEEAGRRTLVRHLSAKLSQEKRLELLVPFLIKNCVEPVIVRQVLSPKLLPALKEAYLVGACEGGSLVMRQPDHDSQYGSSLQDEIVMRPSFRQPGRVWLLFLEKVEEREFDQESLGMLEALQQRGVFVDSDSSAFFRILPRGKGKSAFRLVGNGDKESQDPRDVSPAFINDLKAIIASTSSNQQQQPGDLETNLGTKVASGLAGWGRASAHFSPEPFP